jgi:hypothetical protein
MRGRGWRDGGEPDDQSGGQADDGCVDQIRRAGSAAADQQHDREQQGKVRDQVEHVRAGWERRLPPSHPAIGVPERVAGYPQEDAEQHRRPGGARPVTGVADPDRGGRADADRLVQHVLQVGPGGQHEVGAAQHRSDGEVGHRSAVAGADPDLLGHRGIYRVQSTPRPSPRRVSAPAAGRLGIDRVDRVSRHESRR